VKQGVFDSGVTDSRDAANVLACGTMLAVAIADHTSSGDRSYLLFVKGPEKTG
jgi:hypothetical protein